MTVIARWECPEHGADSGPGKRCGRMARPYVLCHREKVKVEYVPASQLAGAVDLTRRLAEGAREKADSGDSRALADALADYDRLTNQQGAVRP